MGVWERVYGTLDMGVWERGIWDPGYGYLGTGYTMGWALAIPTPDTPLYYPGTPLPTAPLYHRTASALRDPAQRLADSVKTVFSGSPIYRWAD